MAQVAETTPRVWLGGEHRFSLRIGELRALDDQCPGGAFAAWKRLRSIDPLLNDILGTIRLGLIGGGMAEAEAARLVGQVEAEQGVGELIPLAAAVLFAAFWRREDDSLGETVGAETPPSEFASE